jgi:co-chaperonin GroES (HSP10)
LEQNQKGIVMKQLRTIGKWVSVQTKGLGQQKKTSAGIIYTEKLNNPNIWSVVICVGDKVTEDIKVGDRVLWDLTKNGGRGYAACDIVHQDNILAVERDET